MTSNGSELVWYDGDADGSGVPLLIIPGAFSDADSFEAVATWFANRGRRVAVLRLPARMRRVPQLQGGGLAAIDQAVDRACQRLAAEPITLGHSLGAIAALRSSRRRSLPATLLLMPPSPTGLVPQLLRIAISDPLSAAKLTALAGSASPIRRLPSAPPRGLFTDRAKAEELDSSRRRRVSESWQVLAELAVGSRYPIEPARGPTLVVAGAQDTLAPPQAARRLAAKLNAPLWEWDVAHAFHEQDGHEPLLARLDEWIASVLTEPELPVASDGLLTGRRNRNTALAG